MGKAQHKHTKDRKGPMSLGYKAGIKELCSEKTFFLIMFRDNIIRTKTK